MVIRNFEFRRRRRPSSERYTADDVTPIHLGSYGRWDFTEFSEVFQIQADFKATIDANFNKLIEGLAP